MEVNKRASIKSIPYDEFKDNDTLEKIAQELNEGGANVVVGSLDAAINWGRSNSLWSLTFGTSCCGIEFMAVGCARYDFSRFGFEVTRNSPRQADLIMCAGTITNKMAPVFKRLYDEMAEPKYVVAVVGCAISGGPFKKVVHIVDEAQSAVALGQRIQNDPHRIDIIDLVEGLVLHDGLAVDAVDALDPALDGGTLDAALDQAALDDAGHLGQELLPGPLAQGHGPPKPFPFCNCEARG